MKSGEVLSGRYEIEDLAGFGGMGQVNRAKDRATGRPVAVKLVFRRSAGDLLRFEREARILASLDHPRIVKYLGEARDEDGGYVVMEWLEGESLSARLARSRLTLAEALELAGYVAEGIAYAHRLGVIHRDLKPSNLILVGGALDRVKIIDFGLAREEAGGPAITATHATLGTPGYMAPEQAQRPRDVDTRADIYSLGCVLFRCLAGRPPHENRHALGLLLVSATEDAPRLQSVVEGIPDSLDAMVAAMLSRDPRGRPTDIVAAIKAVQTEVSARRIGFNVPTLRAEAAPPPSSRGTVSAASPAADVARAWQPTPPPSDPIDAHGDTARVATISDADPRRMSAPPTPSSPQPTSAAAPQSAPASNAAASANASPARMHPATAALITIVAVVLFVGACGSGCLYCVCTNVKVAPGAVAKDAGVVGKHDGPRPAATTPPRKPH